MSEEELVGYCLGALDDGEAKRVEATLADPVEGERLRRDLEVIRRAIAPLAADRGPHAPPVGLADRTIAFVYAQSAQEGAVIRPAPLAESEASWNGSSSRRWLDRVIIAASALAASILLMPLMLDGISDARDRRAQRNLQSLARSLQGYAESHRSYPTPPGEGPLSRAGLYAPTLVSEHRLVADDGIVLSYDSALARRGTHRVPSLEELRAAINMPRFDEMIQTMGGDYGYTLGYRNAAKELQPIGNGRRRHHPILADAPDETGERSDNHPDGRHYVLFEDGHVERLSSDGIHLDDDHLYRNHDGEIRAGKDDEDAVIGDSHHQP